MTANIKHLIENEQENVSFMSGQLMPIVQNYIDRDIFDFRACLKEWDYIPDEQDLMGQFFRVVQSTIESGNFNAQFYAGLIVGCVAGEGQR
jgi:hypothetical protein